MKGNGKKHTVRVWPIFVMVALLLTGCKAKEDSKITGVIFDRGHGSIWGKQFYIEVRADEIVLARYFPANSQDQEVCEHMPITPEQWNEVCMAVQALDLKEDRPSLWQKLWKSRKLDGGEYKTLTVIWDKKVETAYQWPEKQQSKDLEMLLEQLVVTSK